MSHIRVVRRTMLSVFTRAFTGALAAVVGHLLLPSAVWADAGDAKQVFFGDLHVDSNRAPALNLDFYVRPDVRSDLLSDPLSDPRSNVALGAPPQSTRFTGFEFTARPSSANLHRDLILQSPQNQKGADRFRDAIDADTPEDLWRWMDKRRASGIESLAIVHNPLVAGDLSTTKEATTKEATATQATVRARNEPLAEVTQAEGAVREALKKGLLLQVQRQFNPYKFGLVGAGLTGVWAQENSRPAIYAALRRKETFATTGTKLALRMFAGFRLPDDLHVHPKKSAILLRRAVPMGGELSRGRGPLMLAVEALADAAVERLEVVKGWTDGKTTFEKVFTLADSKKETEKGIAFQSLWRDPEFDPQQPAFYYLRAFEKPSEHLKPRAQQTSQQRAYSSPVWYSPS